MTVLTAFEPAQSDAKESSSPWLTIIGIGDDGLAGLSPAARAWVEAADIFIGGKRHLAMLPAQDERPKLSWPSPASALLPEILALRGQAVCVLATGDPTCYGAVEMLSRQIAAEDMRIIPASSAFALARARVCWSHAETTCLTVHGRPLALLLPHVQPGAKLLILSWDKTSVGKVARTLSERGYSRSRITILEHMGGPKERQKSLLAADWPFVPEGGADLNSLAIECRPDAQAKTLPTLPGLPDDVYQHDGQLTKQEVRAITLSALAPFPGQTLWDLGAGCGSVAIEWMRTHPRCQAIAVEHHAKRRAMMAYNAESLGVPGLEIRSGSLPEALQDLPGCPEAIFLGGAVSSPGLLEACWQRLAPGGRLVANAVTLDSEQVLLAFQASFGGQLTRLSISRADSVKRKHLLTPEHAEGLGECADGFAEEPEGDALQRAKGPLIWRPFMPVTQIKLQKAFQ